MVSIFQYTDPCLFLRDSYEEIKRRNSQFSIRSWARMMGLNHHNPLFEMMGGKRKIARSMIPYLSKSLKLGRSEALYFYELVNLQRAKSFDERELVLEKLSRLSQQKKLSITEMDTFKCLRDPLHIIVAELTRLPDFQEDPTWIKERLSFRVSNSAIASSLRRLLKTGLLIRDEDGRLKKTSEHLYSKSDVVDLGLQSYHLGVMNLGEHALKTQDILEREYNALCLTIDRKNLTSIKKYLRQFIHEFVGHFESTEEDGTDLYQLNTQFFNLTKNKGEKR